MKVLTALMALVVCAGISEVHAQSYPTRAVTLIVPFAAGGPADITGRIVADIFSRAFGQQFIVENVTGAGGTTGTTRGARATADGYTLSLGHMGTHAAAVALYPNLSYRPEVDFEPIGLVAEQPELLAVRKDLPPSTLKEFATYAKANESKLNMAHAGIGSVSHVGCLLLNAAIGIKPTTVPFTGTGPAISALLPDRWTTCAILFSVRCPMCAPARSRLSQSRPASAARCCRRCQPRRRADCRSSTLRRSMRCLPPGAHRR